MGDEDGGRSCGFRPKKLNLALLGEMTREPTMRELDDTIGLMTGSRGKGKKGSSEGRKRKSDAVFLGADPAVGGLGFIIDEEENGDALPSSAEKKRRGRPPTAKGGEDEGQGVEFSSAAAEASSFDSNTEFGSGAAETGEGGAPAWAGHALLRGVLGSSSAAAAAVSDRSKATTPAEDDDFNNQEEDEEGVTPADDSALQDEADAAAERLVKRAFARVGGMLDVASSLRRSSQAIECLDAMMMMMPAAPPRRGYAGGAAGSGDLTTKRVQLRELLSARRFIDEALSRFIEMGV